VAWATAAPLEQRRDHHLTFVVESDAGAFLHVMGGVIDNATLLDDSEVAAIQADGSLGPWQPGASMPEVAAGAGVAVVGRTLIVTGGYRQSAAGTSTLSSETDVAPILADGSIGEWAVGPALAETRFHAGTIAHGDSVYVVGGLTGDNTENTARVERAVVAADGSVGAWADVGALPEPRSHHGVAATDDALYVTGGLTGNPNDDPTDFKDVLRAPIQGDGSLGPWATVGELPFTLGTHASFAHVGHLYVVAGIENDATNTAAVRRAPIAADGTVGAWEDVAPLPVAHAHAHQVPVFQGFAYAAGGAINHESTADVFIGRFE
jgi:hypothetical protein